MFLSEAMLPPRHTESTRMPPAKPTITVEHLPQQAAIYMNWNRTIIEADVAAAFRTVTRLLDETEQPLCVIVDLRQNPRFPMLTTITEALLGPFQHNKLHEWLIIGSSPLARSIARTLSGVTGRNNIRWFVNEADVFAYLELLQPSVSSSR